MANRLPPIYCEDIPLDEARRRGQSPRMDPERDNALKQKIHSLDNTTTRLMTPEGLNHSIMENRILRAVVEPRIPVTIRRMAPICSAPTTSDSTRPTPAGITRHLKA